jgi:hypothetical protein
MRPVDIIIGCEVDRGDLGAAVTLAMIVLNSPYYVDRLDPIDREAFVATAYDHARRLREPGS